VYWHVGAHRTVLASSVIMVLDMAWVQQSAELRDLVNRLRMDGRLEVIGPEPSRALVLTDTGAILAPVSPQSLRNRVARAIAEPSGDDAMV
jgi:hypothetical protein